MNDGQDRPDDIEQVQTGAPEGVRAEAPGTDEISEMYEELGVKAPAPVDKSKKRSKTTTVRTEDDSKKRDSDSDASRKQDSSSDNKSKNASASDKDVDSGDDNRSDKSQEREEDGKVSGQSKTASERVQSAKSSDKNDSERGDEEGSERGDNGAGQEAHESDDAEEEGKRPGKSDPKIERRFQKLTTDVRERDELIQDLQQKLANAQRQTEADKIAQEDPEYTIDDFRKVRDNEGNILDLDDDRAELAYRRWKDQYDQRSEQRNAERNRQEAIARYQSEQEQKRINDSVEALDTLTNLLDTTPELNSTSDKFDAEFSQIVMPVLNEMLMYVEGTEPGSVDENNEPIQPVIAGLRMNPKVILEALTKVQESKRSLPLNGLTDTVEVGSNKTVPHSRSSDPTVNQANELYRDLGIDKRV